MGGWFTDLCIALHSYARYFSCSQLSKSCQYQKQSDEMMTFLYSVPKLKFSPPETTFRNMFSALPQDHITGDFSWTVPFAQFILVLFTQRGFSQAKRTFNVQFKATLKIEADFFSAFMKEKWQITEAFMLLQCHPEHAVAKLVQVSKQRGEHYVYRSI